MIKTKSATVTQLRALAYLIADEISNLRKAKVVNTKESSEYKARLQQVMAEKDLKGLFLIKELLQKNKLPNYYALDNAIKEAIGKKMQKHFPVLKLENAKRIGSDTILNHLLVESITCDNIEAIRKKVVSKYIS